MDTKYPLYTPKDIFISFCGREATEAERWQGVQSGIIFHKRTCNEFLALFASMVHHYMNHDPVFYAKKLGEIDIIAKKNSIYHFCEVKSATDYETAINNITKSKLSKIKRSVDYYIQTKKLDVSYCIDAIIITDESIDFIENITL